MQRFKDDFQHEIDYQQHHDRPDQEEEVHISFKSREVYNDFEGVVPYFFTYTVWVG